MSEELIPQVEQVPQPPPPGEGPEELLKFYSHSQYIYFWPLWLISFVFAGITYFAGTPTKILNAKNEVVAVIKVYPAPGLGLAFVIILLSVILFTSVNVRGVWAALTAASLVITGLLFSIFQLWKPILAYLGGLNFYLNFHFYLTVGIVMLALWIMVFLFDTRHYLVFRPTQLTIVEEVGEGEKNYDTVGLMFDKKRDNFFQHWLLGFGSGDLEIRTAGGKHDKIHFPNVLNVGSKISSIHQIREQRGR